MSSGQIDITVFNDNGELPAGIHDYDQDLFKRVFVDSFTLSTRRSVIYSGFTRFQKILHRQVSATRQWVDGSFVTSKIDPGDIDVVSFFDYCELNELSDEQQQELKQLLEDRDAIEQSYSTHHFVVIQCTADHPYYPKYCEWLQYWQKWFGTTRPIIDEHGNELPPREKGIVQLSYESSEMSKTAAVGAHNEQ